MGEKKNEDVELDAEAVALKKQKKKERMEKKEKEKEKKDKKDKKEKKEKKDKADRKKSKVTESSPEPISPSEDKKSKSKSSTSTVDSPSGKKRKRSTDQSEPANTSAPPAKISKTESTPTVQAAPTPAPSTKNLSAQEKRKLLWGNKKKKESVWNAADLGDQEKNQKLLKLMGAKSSAASQPQGTTRPKELDPNEINKRFDHLASNFEKGVAARKNRGTGLGFS